ncbi:uncharacterized protein LOC126834196 isoform X2 [Adelges cooleyi]|uniref:uncharacterized protein LOC126834196 isoform X2 n=1 Tax=Adelges cooleyi TaxID=133065 RepID=UPI00217F27AC|nr:uncharacterized protein LOC126834196 isoform X2 [Adelges cooleyi]
MHFKSAVILCALYLITSAWSFGLNSEQLTEIIRLYENHKMSSSEITAETITKFKKEFFGIQEPEKIIPCDSSPKLPTEPTAMTEDDTCTDEANAVDLKKLLLTLAYEDKKTHDSFKTQMLTYFEVEFFLRVFTEHAMSSDQNGCIGVQQLPELLKDLKLKKTEIENIVEKHKVKFVINEADFLLIMLETKPEGYGLDLDQIQMLINLYHFDYISDTGRIDPKEVQDLFIEFNMARPKHDSKLLFECNRSPAKELMELVLVTAERSRKKYTRKGFIHTTIVRSILSDFVEHDKNGDCLLSKKELATMMKSIKTHWFVIPDLSCPRNNEGSKTYIAKFLKIMFSYYM